MCGIGCVLMSFETCHKVLFVVITPVLQVISLCFRHPKSYVCAYISGFGYIYRLYIGFFWNMPEIFVRDRYARPSSHLGPTVGLTVIEIRSPLYIYTYISFMGYMERLYIGGFWNMISLRGRFARPSMYIPHIYVYIYIYMYIYIHTHTYIHMSDRLDGGSLSTSRTVDTTHVHVRFNLDKKNGYCNNSLFVPILLHGEPSTWSSGSPCNDEASFGRVVGPIRMHMYIYIYIHTYIYIYIHI